MCQAAALQTPTAKAVRRRCRRRRRRHRLDLRGRSEPMSAATRRRGARVRQSPAKVATDPGATMPRRRSTRRSRLERPRRKSDRSSRSGAWPSPCQPGWRLPRRRIHAHHPSATAARITATMPTGAAAASSTGANVVAALEIASDLSPRNGGNDRREFRVAVSEHRRRLHGMTWVPQADGATIDQHPGEDGEFASPHV